jgi:hypothetical protein
MRTIVADRDASVPAGRAIGARPRGARRGDHAGACAPACVYLTALGARDVPGDTP